MIGNFAFIMGACFLALYLYIKRSGFSSGNEIEENDNSVQSPIFDNTTITKRLLIPDDYYIKTIRLHQIYFDKEDKTLYALNSRDNLYFVSVYDANRNLIKEINLNLESCYYTEKIRHFKIIILNGKKMIELKYDKLNYYQFDFDGTVHYHKQFSTSGEIILVNYGDDILVSLTKDVESCYSPISIFSIENESINHIDILDHKAFEGKDWGGYEYIAGMATTNKPNQFAVICDFPTYGVEGIKIFENTNNGNTELIFDHDNLNYDYPIRNITFNAEGDRFVTLTFKGELQNRDYFSICVYSIANEQEPIQTFKTILSYRNYRPQQTHYITDTLLCIVGCNDLLIYNLEQGEIFKKTKRDLDSTFYVDFNVVVYQKNGEIVVLEY